MRLILATTLVLTSATASTSGGAFASSILSIGGPAPQSASIVTVHCAGCDGAQAAPSQSSYSVPNLKLGTQRTEVVEIGGEKKLVRTEAWLGGSPVVYVSKLPKWMAEQKPVADLHIKDGGSTESGITAGATGDGVDIDATTSAVAKPLETTVAPAKTTLALESFDLRLSDTH